MPHPTPSRRRFLVLGGLGLTGLGLAGCESMQDITSAFERRNPPLPGQRQPVFPDGVPGIDRSVQQPANAPASAPTEAPPAAPAPANPAPARRE